MDFVKEGIALGINLVMLGSSFFQYVYYKQNIENLKSAPQLTLNKHLKDFVASQKDKRVPYAVIRGTVTPIGEPLRSMLSRDVTGVLQVLKVRECVVERCLFGFWSEQQKLIHISCNQTPFQLQGNELSVEIIRPFSAHVLDLDVAFDHFEPTPPSFLQTIFGLFNGIGRKGVHTTEELLRDGSVITAVGELQLEGDALRLQPSTVGPLFLTTSTKAALIKEFEDFKKSRVVRIILFGTITTIIVGFIVRKLYLRKKKEREDQRLKEVVERERRNRRVAARPTNVSREIACVVCTTNPREIVILPCGHVCLCLDCAENIGANCPVCRREISEKVAAFIT